jgi:hypothetical protein
MTAQYENHPDNTPHEPVIDLDSPPPVTYDSSHGTLSDLPWYRDQQSADRAQWQDRYARAADPQLADQAHHENVDQTLLATYDKEAGTQERFYVEYGIERAVMILEAFNRGAMHKEHFTLNDKFQALMHESFAEHLRTAGIDVPTVDFFDVHAQQRPEWLDKPGSKHMLAQTFSTYEDENTGKKQRTAVNYNMIIAPPSQPIHEQ